jgi:hypothetical protein
MLPQNRQQRQGTGARGSVTLLDRAVRSTVPAITPSAAVEITPERYTKLPIVLART